MTRQRPKGEVRRNKVIAGPPVGSKLSSETDDAVFGPELAPLLKYCTKQSFVQYPNAVVGTESSHRDRLLSEPMQLCRINDIGSPRKATPESNSVTAATRWLGTPYAPLRQ
jgi:hypothetical protein